MTVVELAGMVGSGKSTLTVAARDELSALGLEAMSVTDAIPIVLTRSYAGPVVRLIVHGEQGRRRAFSLLYRFVVRPWWLAVFVIRHRRSLRVVLAALRRSSIGLRHRLTVLGLAVRPGAAQLFLGPRMRADEVLVFDEGLLHRSVNAFSWAGEGVDRSAVEKYLSNLPQPDLIILVDAPKTICIERARARGLPARLSGHGDSAIDSFMANAAEVVTVIARWLRDSEWPHVVVDNGGPPARAEAVLREALSRHLTKSARS